jgi:tetratricopeptide (TPR) repeat protein
MEPYTHTAFYFQKPADCKNSIPSKPDVNNLLQDDEVKDKHLWHEDIAYLEMLKHSKKQRTVNRQSSIRNYSNRFVWIVATSIVLLLTLTTIVFHLKNKGNEELFRQFYAPLHTSIVFPIPQNLPEPLLEKAFHEYVNRNYSYTHKLLNYISPNSNYYSIAQFYSGICDMELNQTDAAIIHFNNIDQHFLLKPYIDWYKGLCYVKLGNLNEAIIIFSEIKSSNSIFNAKAGEILNRLEK